MVLDMDSSPRMARLDTSSRVTDNSLMDSLLMEAIRSRDMDSPVMDLVRVMVEVMEGVISSSSQLGRAMGWEQWVVRHWGWVVV